MAVGPCSAEEAGTCIYILDDGLVDGNSHRTIYRVTEPETLTSQSLWPERALIFE